MDKELLSRILKKLEIKEYIYWERAEKGCRMELIKLTKKGEDICHTLDLAVNRSMRNIFARMDDSQLQDLVKSMTTVLSIMTNN